MIGNQRPNQHMNAISVIIRPINCHENPKMLKMIIHHYLLIVLYIISCYHHCEDPFNSPNHYIQWGAQWMSEKSSIWKKDCNSQWSSCSPKHGIWGSPCGFRKLVHVFINTKWSKLASCAEQLFMTPKWKKKCEWAFGIGYHICKNQLKSRVIICGTVRTISLESCSTIKLGLHSWLQHNQNCNACTTQYNITAAGDNIFD